MPELSNLNVFLKMLETKKRMHINQEKYKLKTNTYIARCLRKLESLELISDLKITKSQASCKLNSLKKVTFYPRPVLNLNKKNYIKLIKQELNNNIYTSFLLTTSTGIMTLKEAITANVGGYIICKYEGNKPVYQI